MSYEELEALVEYMFDEVYDSMAEARALRQMLADYKVITESELDLRIKDIKTEDFLRAKAEVRARAIAKALEGGRVQ